MCGVEEERELSWERGEEVRGAVVESCERREEREVGVGASYSREIERPREGEEGAEAWEGIEKEEGRFNGATEAEGGGRVVEEGEVYWERSLA